jgi:hypothetical protein
MVDVARRLCEDNHIQVAEIWSYHLIGDEPRFTIVHRNREVQPVPRVKPVARPAAPPAAKKAAPRAAKAAKPAKPANHAKVVKAAKPKKVAKAKKRR